MWAIMKQLQNRIIRLLENASIKDPEERKKMEHLIKTKRWNSYCIRHSSITSDSRQASRYIKTRMGDDLKKQILVRNGIITEEAAAMQRKPSVLPCPRCNLVNAIDNK